MQDYYMQLKELSNFIYEKYNLSRFVEANNEKETVLLNIVYKEKLYNLVLDITNQVIYDYMYIFKKEDVEFIIKFDLDKILKNIIEEVSKILIKYEIYNVNTHSINKNIVM